MGVFVIISSILSPLNIAFTFDYPYDTLYKTFDYITLAVFVLDILIGLRASFFTINNEEVIDQKEIALNYVKSSSFLFDMLSTIPISEISNSFVSGNGNSYVIWLK